MKRLIIIVCASVMGGLAAGGCGKGDGGGPASIPFPAFGTEPAPTTGNEPSGGVSIEELCATDCSRFESACPGSGNGAGCAAQCAMTFASLSGCNAQAVAYLSCLTTVSVTCSNGSLSINGCDAESSALSACANGAASPQ